MYRKTLLPTFTVVGVTSIVAQTLFIRELEQIFYGNELCLGVIFAGWLFFTGVGSIVGRKIKKNVFLELQVGLGLILPIEFLMVHSIKSGLRIGPGELISPIYMIIISFIIFAPLSMVIGLLFVQACEWWARETKDVVKGVSRVYILDALGNMAGGFIFAYLLIKLFSLVTLFGMGILNLVLAFILSGKGGFKTRPHIWLRLSILILAGLSLLGLISSKQIEEFSMKLDYPEYEIANYKRSVYGNLVLVKKGSLCSLYENGLLSSTYPTPLRAEETVHFPMLQVKNPNRILLLGGDIELISEILKYPVQELQWVKLDPKSLEVCKLWVDFSPLNDPRVKVIWEDGRGFVKRYKGEKFDLAIISVGEPYTSFLNRFYTLEFFKELKRIMRPNGVVALEIISNPNYLSEELMEYNGTIYKTLEKVFPKIVLVPGEAMQLFGSEKSEWLSDNPDTLSQRIRVPTKYVTKYYVPYKFYRERIDYIRGILDNFNPRVLNQDWRPISYYYDIVLKGAYFSQRLKKIFVFFLTLPSWVTLLTIILVFVLVGFITRAPVFGIGILGATGIGTQLLIILSFEVLYGYMYHKIGIITGGFMLGVAFGARLTEKRGTKLSPVIGCSILYLAVLFLIINFLPKIHPSTFILHPSEFVFYLLPIFAGTLTGCAWTLANRQLIGRGESVERSSGLLNGIDLFGSCIGSFFFSVFFIPIYGFYFSLLLLGAINFIALAFLLKSHS